MSCRGPTMPRQHHVVQDRPEYYFCVIVEDFDGVEVPFVHLDVKKWSPSTFKKILHSWGVFRKATKGNFYAISNRDDIELHKKFVRRLGFKFFRALECPDGKVRPCYISQE